MERDALANIGSGGVRRRYLMGVAGFAVAAAVAALFIVSGVPRSWRLLVILPLWIGTLGVFQARATT
jgi:hypothetical protein